MGRWIWQEDDNVADGFIIPGPFTGQRIRERWGSLFPDDAQALWHRTDGQMTPISWGSVGEMTLAAGEALELPGIPVAAGPLLYVMSRLLGPGGCPWDRQQTSMTLLRYLLDESYEAAEALVAQDWDGFEDELGDVLLQIVFHAALLPEIDFASIVNRQTQKLIRRHPHVFQAAEAHTGEEVRQRWEALKAGEPPRPLKARWVYPALVAAKRAAKAGDHPKSAVFQAVLESLEVYLTQSPGKIEEILGDAAWAVSEAARRYHQDAEWALWQRVVALASI